MIKKNKFEFNVEFQQLILQYTVTDPAHGSKIIKLYDDTFFTIIPHAVIAFILKKFYTKRKRLPSEVVFREKLREFYKAPKTSYPLESSDKKKIDIIVSEIYSKPVVDGDEIMERCINFARYISFRRELENVDINKFDSYSAYADKLKKAQNIGMEAEDDNGMYMVAHVNERILNRDTQAVSFPTPYWQFNKLLNAAGTTRGNIIMLVSQAKRFKTGSLINVAKGYMRLRKKILYIDYENGQDALSTRGDQSIMHANQKEVLAGTLDKDLKKIMRRYRRIGAELVIKRMQAYKDTAADVEAYMDDQYNKTGIIFNVIIADYLDLSGSTSGFEDDTKRIDAAYVEWKNMADRRNIEALWTASHVTREAGKRRTTKYEQNDLAKCIDKIRHCDVAIGIQENDAEIEAGVHRWEIIDQRNGMQYGNMLFWVDIEKQSLKEFSRAEVKRYRDQTGEEDTGAPKRKERKSDL